MSQTILYPGQRGPQITELQQPLSLLLQQLGAPPIPAAEIETGHYGPGTTAAILHVQRLGMERGLSRPDGTPYGWADIDGRHGSNTAHLMELLRAPAVQEPSTHVEASPVSDPGILERAGTFFTAIMASPAAAATPDTPRAVEHGMLRRPMPGEYHPVSGPVTHIWPADILEVTEYDRAIRRSGLSQQDLARHLTDTARVLNELDESVRGSATLAVRQMYLQGQPVTIDTRYPANSGTREIALHLKPAIAGERLDRRERERLMQAADARGLQADIYNDNSFRLTVDLHYEDAEDLRLDLRAIHGDTPIRPVHPVPGYAVNSNFGIRNDPFTRRAKPHAGVDIAAELGTPVRSVMPGVVRRVHHSRGRYDYGTFVEIEEINTRDTPGEKVTHFYAHLDGTELRVGQPVQQGAIIGTVGSTGRSTGPHLHYERRVNGRAVNPMDAGENSLRAEHTTPVRAYPRQLAEAATEVVTRASDRVSRQLAAAEAARQEMVKNVVEGGSQAVEVAANLAQNAWRGARGFLGRG